jgi:hypothetical protein
MLIVKNPKLKSWSEGYFKHIQRNIGPIKLEEQEILRTHKIGILGVGGLGGPLIEQLVRTGCQNFVICDDDKFDESNLNRQLCTLQDMGRYKVDITEEFLKKIDPEIKIDKYYKITKDNISEILREVDLIALMLDDLTTSILIARECRERNIPMVESWGIPLLFAWWFTPNNIDYESCYGLNSHSLSITQIKEENLMQNLTASNILLPKLFAIPGVTELYNREPNMFSSMMEGAIPLRSFSPFVRMTASYLAIEVIFTGLLKLRPMILAPQIKGFDYIRMTPIDTTIESS